MSPLTSREREILQILSDDTSKTVTEISEILEVSTVTIRSNLKTLAEKGLIVRTHGGAVPAFHPAILERQKQMVEEKEKIAKAAAGHVKDGDNIMIVAGTTTPLVVKYLLGKSDVHVVTNSTLALPYARINPSLRITIVGGEFRPSAEAILGPDAVTGFGRFHVHKAFLGTDGYTCEKGITANSVEVAEIVKAAARMSDECWLLADSTKYGRTGFAHIMGLAELDGIITDADMPADAIEEIEALGLAVKTTS
jgi:DeoR family galactitol utilization operon repressor